MPEHNLSSPPASVGCRQCLDLMAEVRRLTATLKEAAGLICGECAEGNVPFRRELTGGDSLWAHTEDGCDGPDVDYEECEAPEIWDALEGGK